jgi:L-galactose dehydrogenase
MDTVTLGRTGLKTSVAGLGCGGRSRLGLGNGASEAHCIDVVRAALDLGVNFFDTAPAYGTEGIVGAALEGRRDGAIVSTKSHATSDHPSMTPMTGAELMVRIEASLKALRTDVIDVFSLHAVQPELLDHVNAELVPALQRAQAHGKIRFLGITEHYRTDHAHVMMPRALESGVWDVVMVGFNLINQSARERIFKRTRADNVAVQDMFAVRKLHDPARVRAIVQKAAAAGQVDLSQLDLSDPLGFLSACAKSPVEGAYRYCRHEPGVSVVLTGTGSIPHLRENVAALNQGPLPGEVLAKLLALFGAVDCVSGE